MSTGSIFAVAWEMQRSVDLFYLCLLPFDLLITCFVNCLNKQSLRRYNDRGIKIAIHGRRLDRLSARKRQPFVFCHADLKLATPLIHALSMYGLRGSPAVTELRGSLKSASELYPLFSHLEKNRVGFVQCTLDEETVRLWLIDST